MVRPTSSGRKAAAVLKMVSPSGTPRVGMRQWRQAQRKAEILAGEAGLLQLRTERRGQGGLTVDAFDAELAAVAVFGNFSERSERQVRVGLEGGQGDDALVAALDVQGGLAVEQDDVGAGHALQLLRPR